MKSKPPENLETTTFLPPFSPMPFSSLLRGTTIRSQSRGTVPCESVPPSEGKIGTKLGPGSNGASYRKEEVTNLPIGKRKILAVVTKKSGSNGYKSPPTLPRKQHSEPKGQQANKQQRNKQPGSRRCRSAPPRSSSWPSRPSSSPSSPSWPRPGPPRPRTASRTGR